MNPSFFVFVAFSGSGNFTTLGANTITLTNMSTPNAAGSFDYTPTGGCLFSITYTGGGGGGYFLTCKVNGVLNTFNDNLTGSLDNSSSPYNFIIHGVLPGGSDDFTILVSDANNPIAEGSTYNAAITTPKYCFINYNSGGVLYSTSTVNPSSFSVTITKNIATEVSGTFNGTLYDVLTLAPKSISEGSFYINP